MTNIIIAFDEKDGKLGSFFSACKADLDSFFNSIVPDYLEINSEQLYPEEISSRTKAEDFFVLGAYSHGKKSSLYSSKGIYISSELNGKDFKNSFFYTFSCSTARKLGKELIEHGCLCFIGYDRTIHVWDDDQYLDVFVETANKGLKAFINGKSTEDVFEVMTETYNEHIDALYEKDYTVAAVLVNNRNALKIYGDNILFDYA